jgi:transposase-like protein
MNCMKAYSFDLRQRGIEAVDRGLATYAKIAATSGVSQSFLYKLLRHRGDRPFAAQGRGHRQTR